MIPDFRDDGTFRKGYTLQPRLRSRSDSVLRRLALRLRRWTELSRSFAANRRFVDGSFVTAKPERNDVNAVIWLAEDFVDQVSLGDLEAVELEDMLYETAGALAGFNTVI